MVVPTRSRPGSVGRLVRAWEETGAFDDDARLLFAADEDDPQWETYRTAVAAAGHPRVGMVSIPEWRPMVQKLDAVALGVAGGQAPPVPFAVGFAGDDHVPRTRGWVGACVAELRDVGSGIVYGADGYQNQNLPTWWVMTADLVRWLGRMVPAPVEHLYCDNAIRDLGQQAGCLRYLPNVLVEHMNPYADGKAEMDAQYRQVNSTAQYRRDSAAYALWRRRTLPGQVAMVREMVRG